VHVHVQFLLFQHLQMVLGDFAPLFLYAVRLDFDFAVGVEAELLDYLADRGRLQHVLGHGQLIEQLQELDHEVLAELGVVLLVHAHPV